jgi:hypothetical protein
VLQPTEDDEIMAEVRRNREAIWARFGYDWDLVMEEARRCAKDFKEEVRARIERQKREAAK